MIPERVRAVRKQLDMTQAKFGECLGVSVDIVKNLEYGRVAPSDLIINMICARYGVDEHWLRTGEGKMFSPKSPDDEFAELVGDLLADEEDNFRRRLVTAICKLDDNQIKAVKEFMREIVEGEKK